MIKMLKILLILSLFFHAKTQICQLIKLDDINTLSYTETSENYGISCSSIDKKLKKDEIISDIKQYKNYSLKYIEISNKYMPDLDDFLLENITFNSLKLISNGIQTISNKTFIRTASLKEIHLNKNNIKEILSFVSGLQSSNFSLTILSLRYNEIRDVNFVFGRTFTSLERLDLAFNKLEFIKQDAFLNLISLKYLFLANNNLTSIDMQMFSYVSRLEELELSSNPIYELDVFKVGLKNLKKFYLRYLKLAEVKSELLANLTDMVDLDMGYCRIERVSNEMFRGLSRLVYLNLYSNSIGEIQMNSFKDLAQLAYLDLFENKLTEIRRHMFVGLVELQILGKYIVCSYKCILYMVK